MKQTAPLVGYSAVTPNCKATLKVEELELDIVTVTLYDTYECSTMRVDKGTFQNWLTTALSKI